MKKALVLAAFLLPFIASAQETKTVKKVISQNLTEKYTISKETKNKEGLYLVLDIDGKPLARGIFKDNQRQGIWSFFDQSTNVVQRYDYTNSKLVYINTDTNSFVKANYIVDAPDNAKVNPPIKIGGDVLGMLAFFKTTDIPNNIARNANGVYLTYDIEVSETGKVGNVYLQYKTRDGALERKKIYYNENFSLLDCVPATVNGTPVKSDLLLSAFINSSNTSFRKGSFVTDAQVPGGLPIPAGVGYVAPAYAPASAPSSVALSAR